jgi:translation elongation factor EF-Tu-like GTPase
MIRLTVESVHRMSSRPWIFVTGRLEGGELCIGDELTVTRGNAPVAFAVVRSIELHGPPGTTTVAIDVDLADSVKDGVVLVGD